MKKIKTLSAFVETILINVTTFVNQFFTLAKTDVKKLSDIVTLYSKNFLIENCNLFAYCFDATFASIVKIEKLKQLQLTTKQLKIYHANLLKLSKQKNYFVHLVLIAFVPLDKPLTIYSNAKKCNMQLSNKFPVIISFTKIVKNNIVTTQIDNTLCFNFNQLNKTDMQIVLHKTDMYLQKYFVDVCKLPESFYVASKQKRN